MPECPGCGTEKVVKNGHIHNSKQRYLCGECGRQFVANPTQKRISPETKEFIDRLLFEKISLAGIARVCDVSQVWLQKYINQKYEQVPQKIEMDSPPKKGRLTIECDEMWSYVGTKSNKSWIWLAIDVSDSTIVGAFIGDRSEAGFMEFFTPRVPKACLLLY